MKTAGGCSNLTRVGAAGFTLLEMLVVMAIIAATLAVAIPALRKPPDSLRLETAARTVSSVLRLARAEAIARNREIAMEIDTDSRLLRSPATPPLRLEEGLLIKLTLAAPEQRNRNAGAILFFPDGTSSGGDIVLSLAQRHVTVSSNWLTGITHLKAVEERK